MERTWVLGGRDCQSPPSRPVQCTDARTHGEATGHRSIVLPAHSRHTRRGLAVVGQDVGMDIGNVRHAILLVDSAADGVGVACQRKRGRLRAPRPPAALCSCMLLLRAPTKLRVLPYRTKQLNRSSTNLNQIRYYTGSILSSAGVDHFCRPNLEAQTFPHQHQYVF